MQGSLSTYLGREGPILASDLDLDDRLGVLVLDAEGEVLHVGLDVLVVELAPDEAPRRVSRARLAPG